MSAMDYYLGRIAAMAAVLALTACGGGGGSHANNATQQTASAGQPTTNPEVLTVVGRAVDGPIVGADILVIDAKGEILKRFENATDNTGRFRLELRDNMTLPAELRLVGGTDQISGRPMALRLRSLIPGRPANDSSRLRVNINPATTLAVDTARHAAGGLASIRPAAMTKATADVAESLDLTTVDPFASELDADAVRGFLIEQLALAEALRRAAPARGGDLPARVETTARAIGLDLSDGTLDGLDANRQPIEPRVSRRIRNALTEVRSELDQDTLNVSTGDGGLTNVPAFTRNLDTASRAVITSITGNRPEPQLPENDDSDTQPSAQPDDPGNDKGDGANGSSTPAREQGPDTSGDSSGDPADNSTDADHEEDSGPDEATDADPESENGADPGDTANTGENQDGDDAGDTDGPSNAGDDAVAGAPNDSGESSNDDDDPDTDKDLKDGNGGDSAETTEPDTPPQIAVEWRAPLHRQNGDDLYPRDLDGYDVRLRAADGTYEDTVELHKGDYEEMDGPGLVQYLLPDDTASGTYELAVRARDIDGRLSPYSQPYTITIE